MLRLPPDASRKSKTPSGFHSMTALEDVVSEKGKSLWRHEFYNALDLVRSEIKHWFDQAGKTVESKMSKFSLIP